MPIAKKPANISQKFIKESHSALPGLQLCHRHEPELKTLKHTFFQRRLLLPLPSLTGCSYFSYFSLQLQFLLARTSRLQQLTTCRLASKLDNLFAKTRFNLFARVRSLYLNCLWMMPTPKHARAQKNVAENLKKDLKKDLIFWPRSFFIFQITPRSDPFFKKGSRSPKRS